MVMGRDWCGEGFYADNVAIDYSKWLNPKVGIRIGAEVGEISSHLLDSSQDKAPYARNKRRSAISVGMDYLPNPNTLISFTAFFDNIDLNGFNDRYGASRLYTRGFNANFVYRFNEESRICLSLTVAESNNPYSFANPYSPYGNPYYTGGFSPLGFADFGAPNAFTSFWLP